MTGWLAIYCNPATWRFRFDQMAAWMDSQASGSQVWRDRVAVLKAGYLSEDQLRSRLRRGDTRPRYPPKAMSDNYLTANLWGPVGQTAAWVLAAKFLPSSRRQGRDFVPGPVAVEVRDTNHWATEANWNRREEKSARTKVPGSGYILKRKSISPINYLYIREKSKY